MKKRIVSFVMSVIIICSLAVCVSADSTGIFSKSDLAHAAGIAAVAREYGDSYSFGDNGVSMEELRNIITVVYNDNPELFHLSSNYSYNYKTDPVTGKNIVTRLILKYSMPESDYQSAMSVYNNWIDEVTSLADPSFTDLEYALFFHDYICANYEYDMSMSSRSAYSMIKLGKGVCQAYTYVYAALLKNVGIEVSFASSAEMDHIWNLVKLDGEWYHVDVTWDDPVGQTPGIAKHKFFLLSDKAIYDKSTEGHYAWVSPYTCDSTKYDRAVMLSTLSAYAYAGDKWYYISDGDLYSTTSPLSAGTLVKDFNYKWYLPGMTSYYTGNYSALLAYNGNLYVSTPNTILRIDPASGSEKEIYKYSGNDGYIYGFSVNTGDDGYSGAGLKLAAVKIKISASPSETGKIIDFRLEVVIPKGKGDANGDGKVNLNDASLILKYIAKWNVTINENFADFDSNGNVNLSDVSEVLKMIAGWYN